MPKLSRRAQLSTYRDLVGHCFRGYDHVARVRRTWVCTGYYESRGLDLATVDSLGPARVTCISERAVSRTFHEVREGQEEDVNAELAIKRAAEAAGVIIDDGTLTDSPFISDGTCRIYHPNTKDILGEGPTVPEAWEDYIFKR